MDDINGLTQDQFEELLQWLADSGVPAWMIRFVSNLFYNPTGERQDQKFSDTILWLMDNDVPVWVVDRISHLYCDSIEGDYDE